MSKKPVKDMAASVRARLLNLSRQRNEQFQMVLTRYAIERLLYRLSRSSYQNQFILKGAILFGIWSDEPHRPTHDVDLLGRGDSTVAYLEQVFREICDVQVEDDGLKFDTNALRGEAVREDLEYVGVRIHTTAFLDAAKVRVQVDIGFGDAVMPRPAKMDIPTLLDLPVPRLRVYPREAVIAEKYHAMIILGITNSRMKDFYDLWVLSRQFEFDGGHLCAAIQATFRRRGTDVPAEFPHALFERISRDIAKQLQWAAFVKKGMLAADPPPFTEMISGLGEFLSTPTAAAAGGNGFRLRWTPPGPWVENPDSERSA